MLRVGAETDQWERLEIYRQRYSIQDRLAPVISLEKSIGRRRMRAASLTRRLDELLDQIGEVRAELAAIEIEIDRSRQAGALLIEEILDQVQVEMGEAWSPDPIRGFRVWRIEDDRVMGNQVHWDSPTLESECLREIPGEDLPHAMDRCGPPACGIYTVKDLDMFPTDVARGMVHNSVVGVVAMYGKVVEHSDGYRSQKATAVAISANDGRHRFISNDSNDIQDFFLDPVTVLSNAKPLTYVESDPTREFLETVWRKEKEWT